MTRSDWQAKRAQCLVMKIAVCMYMHQKYWNRYVKHMGPVHKNEGCLDAPLIFTIVQKSVWLPSLSQVQN